MPEYTVTITLADGSEVTCHPSDIDAMIAFTDNDARKLVDLALFIAALDLSATANE